MPVYGAAAAGQRVEPSGGPVRQRWFLGRDWWDELAGNGDGRHGTGFGAHVSGSPDLDVRRQQPARGGVLRAHAAVLPAAAAQAGQARLADHAGSRPESHREPELGRVHERSDRVPGLGAPDLADGVTAKYAW